MLGLRKQSEKKTPLFFKVWASYQHSLHAAAFYLQRCQSQLKALDSASIEENMSPIILPIIQMFKEIDISSVVWIENKYYFKVIKNLHKHKILNLLSFEKFGKINKENQPSINWGL